MNLNDAIPLPGLLRRHCVLSRYVRCALIRWVLSVTLHPALFDGAWPALLCVCGWLVRPAIVVVGLRGCVCLLSVSLSRQCWCLSAWVCVGMVARGWSRIDEARASGVGQDQWGPGARLASTPEVPPDATSHELYLLWSLSLVPVLWLPCGVGRVPSGGWLLVCLCVSSWQACLLRAFARSLCSPLPGVSLVLC